MRYISGVIRSWELQESSGSTVGRFAGKGLMLSLNRTEWWSALTFVRLGGIVNLLTILSEP